MAGYRDDDKFTEQRFFVEKQHSDVLFIIDREAGSGKASLWTDDQELADRITHLLNTYGMVDPSFMDR